MIGRRKVMHVPRQRVTLKTTRKGLIAKLNKEMEYILMRNKGLVASVVKDVSEKRSIMEERDALFEELVINKIKQTEKLKELIDEFRQQKEVFDKYCDNFVSRLQNQVESLNDSLKSDKNKDSGQESLEDKNAENEIKRQLTEEWRLESRLKSFESVHQRFDEVNQLSGIPEESDYKTPENSAVKKYTGSAEASMKSDQMSYTLDKSITPRTPSIFNFVPVLYDAEYSCIESPTNVGNTSFQSINSEVGHVSVNQQRCTETRSRRTSLVKSKSPITEIPVRRSSIFNCRDPKKVRFSYTSHNLSFQVYSPRDRRMSRRESKVTTKEDNPSKARKCKKLTAVELVEEDIYQFGDEPAKCETPEQVTASNKVRKKGRTQKISETAVRESEFKQIRSPSISEYTPQIALTKGYVLDNDKADMQNNPRRQPLSQIQSNKEKAVDEAVPVKKKSTRQRKPTKRYDFRL